MVDLLSVEVLWRLTNIGLATTAAWLFGVQTKRMWRTLKTRRRYLCGALEMALLAVVVGGFSHIAAANAVNAGTVCTTVFVLWTLLAVAVGDDEEEATDSRGGANDETGAEGSI